MQFRALQAHEPLNPNSNRNVSGILVDTSHFTIIRIGAIKTKYFEEHDSNIEKDFHLPYVFVSDNVTGRTTDIAAVHVNGCNSQYPKTGLEVLAQKMDVLQKGTLGHSDIIAAGDFNTPPMNVRKSIPLDSSRILLKAPYATHVNPKCEAANYDQAVVFMAKESEKKYEILPVTALSESSQALVSSIERSRQEYIEKPRL